MSITITLNNCGDCKYQYFDHNLEESRCKKHNEKLVLKCNSKLVVAKKATYNENDLIPIECPLRKILTD